MTQYIYGLHNGDCEIRYIGKTNDPRQRLFQHQSKARTMSALPVHNWMRKYGPENIEMVIEAELSDDEDIDNYEIAYIDMYRNFGNLLNVAVGGGGCYGFTPSEETKAKFSAAMKGRKQSPEHVTKRIAPHIGSKRSEETRAAQAQRKRELVANDPAFVAHLHTISGKGVHTRWHVNRNIISPECKFCQEVLVNG